MHARSLVESVDGSRDTATSANVSIDYSFDIKVAVPVSSCASLRPMVLPILRFLCVPLDVGLIIN